MAAPTNAINSAAINYGLSREFSARFNHDTNQLLQYMGIITPEPVAAGYALEQHSVKGSLNNQGSGASDAATAGTSGTGYVEGDLVALSKFTVDSKPVGKAKLLPYRKVTTAQAIAEHGVRWSVLNTDSKMLAAVRADILGQLFAFLGNGTGAATGKNLQAALAQSEAKLGDALETNNDTPIAAIHFVSRFDVADYLSDATVTTQTAFGMNYLENFLGVQNVLVSSRVPKGTLYTTDAANIHCFSQDFSSLADAGLAYVTSDNGLIGVAHTTIYDHVSVETNVLTGMLLFPEVTDYIVKGTISAR
jgi:hypothetical protein